MSKRLYVYTAILAITYIIFFGNRVYEIIDAGIGGAKLGMREFENGEPSNFDVLGGKITPKEGTATFPSAMINNKTGENIRIEFREAIFYLKQLPNIIPLHIKILKISNSLLIFILIGIFIYLPFIAYKVIKSVSKDKFYTIQNINKIREIPILLLCLFFVDSIYKIFTSIINSFYIQLEEYNIIMEELNYSCLFIGLVILILSEILRYTLVIKEEQELTV